MALISVNLAFCEFEIRNGMDLTWTKRWMNVLVNLANEYIFSLVNIKTWRLGEPLAGLKGCKHNLNELEAKILVKTKWHNELRPDWTFTRSRANGSANGMEWALNSLDQMKLGIVWTLNCAHEVEGKLGVCYNTKSHYREGWSLGL